MLEERRTARPSLPWFVTASSASSSFARASAASWVSSSALYPLCFQWRSEVSLSQLCKRRIVALLVRASSQANAEATISISRFVYTTGV